MNLPTALHTPILAALDEAVARTKIVPSAAALSRWRLILDVGEMLCMRADNDSEYATGSNVRYLMADSSHQKGREFEYIVCLEVEHGKLQQACRASIALVHMWDDTVGVEDDGERLELDEQQHNLLLQLLLVVVFPIVVLGSGRVSLLHKFQAVLHAFALVASNTINGLRDCIHSFVTSTK